MEQKKRQGLGSGTLGAHAPGEMGDEDDDSATIATWPDTSSTAWTATAHRATIPGAGDAPHVALTARPSVSADVDFVHQYGVIERNAYRSLCTEVLDIDCNTLVGTGTGTGTGTGLQYGR
jgi:hypothetical protein